jgi:hypothetical protein
MKVQYGIVSRSGSTEISRGIPDPGRPFPSKGYCFTTCPATNKIIFKFKKENIK